MTSEARCEAVRLILSDVDGVLTDGGVIFDNQGIETKRFHIRDGLGIKLWQRAGHRFGIVTGRSSHVVQVRAAELGIDPVRQGMAEKLPAVEEILRELGLAWENLCYIGDDLPDLPIVLRAGLGVAVADAADDLRQRADHTTTLPGGAGAVRELVEMILKQQRRWDELIQKYL
jgi:YrbI family 3-deoxy-D-manno-octulosonate 8-phosphate phosphatase